MRYLFITTGSAQFNSSFMRPREFGRCLAAEGVDVHYAVDAGPFNDTLPGMLQFATFHRVKGFGRAGRLLTRRRLISKLNPDVIHVLNPQPSNTATVFGTRQFVVVDWDELLSTRSHSWAINAISGVCERYCRRRADLTVVASRHMQRLFQERYALAAVYVPYATYLEPRAEGESPFTRASAVYLGNLHHDADHDILLDAWSRPPLNAAESPDLHMIGGGTELDKVRTRVRQCGLGKVFVHGYLPWDEVWRHIRHAGVLVFPIRDTLGNRMRCPAKVFAYMQTGRPIITNRVGEVAEALRDNAVYVQPNADAFAAAIVKVVAENRPDFQYPLEEFTWQARTRSLLNAVRDALGNKR
jgi:glycosyltransferase involved in cell wall biosynthesis